MRGADGYTEALFTMGKLDDFVPASHPLRPIRIWLNDALRRLTTSRACARSQAERRRSANPRGDSIGST
jgi:hypothetical protein